MSIKIEGVLAFDFLYPKNDHNMKYLLGIKQEMTQIFDSKGVIRPCTVVKAGPCTVVGVRTQEKDGYVAIQIGYSQKKNRSKAHRGLYKDVWSGDARHGFRYIKEARMSEIPDVQKGDQVMCDTFKEGEHVEVTGWSKGKGFAGVVKRHGFHGHPSSHGHKDQERMPGSIGAGGNQHVFKGVRMAGRMGGGRVTVKDLEIISVDVENGLLTIGGALPGARNGLLMIRAEGMFETAKKKQDTPKETGDIEAKEQSEEIKDASEQGEEK